MTSFSKRLRDAREAKGYSQSELARRADCKQQIVNNLESGNQRSTKYLVKLAETLGVRPEWLQLGRLPRETPTRSLEKSLGEGWVFIKGQLEMGVWRENVALPREEWTAVPAVPDERYPNSDRQAYEIVDRSMDEIYAPGSFVICIPMDQFPTALPNKQRVIVKRHQGALTEITCNEIMIDDDGKLWLQTRSTVPKLKKTEHFDINAKANNTEIICVVIGSYHRE